MTNRELQDTLAMLELVSSVLAIQLLLQSRLQDNDDDALLVDNNRNRESIEVRLRSIEERLACVESQIGVLLGR